MLQEAHRLELLLVKECQQQLQLLLLHEQEARTYRQLATLDSVVTPMLLETVAQEMQELPNPPVLSPTLREIFAVQESETSNLPKP